MSNQEFDDLILAFVEDSSDHLEHFERLLMSLDAYLEGQEWVDASGLSEALRPLHTVKGNSGMLGMMSFSAAVHEIEEVVKGAVDAGMLNRARHDILYGALSLLRGALLHIQSTLQDAEEIEDAVRKLCLALDAEDVSTPVQTQAGNEAADEDGGDNAKQVVDVVVRSSDTLRIRQGRLDLLLSEAGELAIYLNSLQDQIEQLYDNLPREMRYELVTRVDRVMSSFQRTQSRAVELRMVKLDALFSQVPGWVRDLSRSLGKSVGLEIDGSENMIDKTIVDRLQEPFVHIIRNAIDHGIEDPKTRLASGKDEKGFLNISAYSDAGSLIIEIRDDGGGLRRDKLIAKARSVGLVGENEEPANWQELIFEGGLSTNEDVTEISGRGVGMDIVRDSISRMDGSINVESEEGLGTQFRIELPLTLAVTDLLCVQSGQQVYGIPVRDIVETDSCASKAFEKLGEVEYLRTGAGAELVSVVDPEVFDAHASSTLHRDDRYFVVIRKGGKDVILLADELLGERQSVLKPLRDELFAHPFVRSGSIQGDGSVMFVLDSSAILREHS
jgi:two-component system chemotaxis sensor kinase CheA